MRHDTADRGRRGATAADRCRWTRPLATVVVCFSAVVVSWGCTPAGGASDPARDTAAQDRDKVVLLHGLGRSSRAMAPLAERLETAGYDVTLVGYDSFGTTPRQVVAQAAQQIDACCSASPTPVHFVGHSLGGLVIRAYLADHAVPNLGRVVMLGTPNQGVPLVDRHRDAWWMRLAGPMAKALGTGASGFARRLPPPTYDVGVIAGVAGQRRGAQPGDGLVPVASTWLDGMQDFTTVQVGHSMMRRDARVARQTLAFLRNGRFDATKPR